MSYLLKHRLKTVAKKYDKKNPPRVNEGDKIFKLLKLPA
jgi:hypothetical protein